MIILLCSITCLHRFIKTLFRCNNFVEVINFTLKPLNVINPSRIGRFRNLSSVFKSLKHLRCHIIHVHAAIKSCRTMYSRELCELKYQNTGAYINFKWFTRPSTKTPSPACDTKQRLNILKNKKLSELCLHVNYLQLEIDPTLNGFLRRRL